MNNKFFLFVSLVISLGMLFSSCTKKDTTTPYTNYGLYYFVGVGSASQVVPANPKDSSTGGAEFYGVYDSTLQIFNYTLSWTGLTSKVTGMNFYNGADSGQVAASTRVIATYNSTSYLSTSYTYRSIIWNYGRLTGTEVANMINGKWYFSIFTQNYNSSVGGEIRGQIKYAGFVK